MQMQMQQIHTCGLNCMILRCAFQVLKYCGSSAGHIVDLLGSYWGVGSVALDWRSPTSARLRACVEAVLTWELVQTQYASLEEKKLDRIYTGIIYRPRNSFKLWLLVLKHSESIISSGLFSNCQTSEHFIFKNYFLNC
jgi:hypothetical protein